MPLFLFNDEVLSLEFGLPLLRNPNYCVKKVVDFGKDCLLSAVYQRQLSLDFRLFHINLTL